MFYQNIQINRFVILRLTAKRDWIFKYPVSFFILSIRKKKKKRVEDYEKIRRMDRKVQSVDLYCFAFTFDPFCNGVF